MKRKTEQTEKSKKKQVICGPGGSICQIEFSDEILHCREDLITEYCDYFGKDECKVRNCTSANAEQTLMFKTMLHLFHDLPTRAMEAKDIPILADYMEKWGKLGTKSDFIVQDEKTDPLIAEPTSHTEIKAIAALFSFCQRVICANDKVLGLLVHEINRFINDIKDDEKSIFETSETAIEIFLILCKTLLPNEKSITPNTRSVAHVLYIILIDQLIPLGNGITLKTITPKSHFRDLVCTTQWYVQSPPWALVWLLLLADLPIYNDTIYEQFSTRGGNFIYDWFRLLYLSAMYDGKTNDMSTLRTWASARQEFGIDKGGSNNS